MAVSKFVDSCRFLPTAGGTTDFTYSSAVGGYQSPSAAGITNGSTYSYRAESADLTQWEVGTGSYNTSTGVLSRTVVLFNSSATGTGSGQSGAGTKINFSTTPQVAIVALAEDLNGFLQATNNLSDVGSASTSRNNLGALGKVVVQKFTASGTYTPTANMLYCTIECVGGGGGGGGIAGQTGQFGGGGGGGGGSYARIVSTAATIGGSQTVTIGAGGAAGTAGNNAGGAGGDTSLGLICIGKGGSGGSGSSGQSATGGAGGVAGTGTVTVVGSGGGPPTAGSAGGIYGVGGQGGASMFGPATQSFNQANAASAGTAGSGYGSGGCGGVANNSATNVAGGAGASGIVIITEFCSS